MKERIPYITHVDLKNWRNFTDAQADLGRHAILAGPSASGKSNFLDLFRFLRDLVSEGGGFQEAVRRRGGVHRLRCLAARQFPNIRMYVRVGSEERPAEWEYELSFNQDNQPRPTVKRERLARLGTDLISRPDACDQADPERLERTCLEYAGLYKDIRELASFLRSPKFAGVLQPSGDFIDEMASTPDRTRATRLRRILEALQRLAPHLMELDAGRDSHGRPHLRARYGHWRSRGAWQDERQLSDGTLRLIEILWRLLDGAGPCLVEEPEISLHTQAVRLLPSILRRLQRRSGRQLILSTHSPDLCEEAGEVLLFVPGPENTIVRPALAAGEARTLLETGALPGVSPAAQTPGQGGRQIDLFNGEPAS